MNLKEKFFHFIGECVRVLRVTKKPTKEEYWTITKVSAIGILIIGLLGFILHALEVLTSLIIVSIIVIVLVVVLLFFKRGSND